MADQDLSSVLVALGEGRGKPPSATLPKINECGDIGLKIGRDGTWSYQGSAIARKPLVKLFASVLRREEDGRHFLVTPVERVVIEVEDTPFVGVAMTVEGGGERQLLGFRTNLDEVVQAGAEHPLSFRVEPDGSFTPLIIVREELTARIARAVYYDLVSLAVEGPTPEGRGLGVWSQSVFFPFPVAAPIAIA